MTWYIPQKRKCMVCKKWFPFGYLTNTNYKYVCDGCTPLIRDNPKVKIVKLDMKTVTFTPIA